MDTDYTRLPVEVWVQIFSQLDAPSLASTQQTCRLFDEIIRQHDLTWSGACYPIQPREGQSWRQLCQQLWDPEAVWREELGQLNDIVNLKMRLQGSLLLPSCVGEVAVVTSSLFVSTRGLPLATRRS